MIFLNKMLISEHPSNNIVLFYGSHTICAPNGVIY